MEVTYTVFKKPSPMMWSLGNVQDVEDKVAEPELRYVISLLVVMLSLIKKMFISKF